MRQDHLFDCAHVQYSEQWVNWSLDTTIYTKICPHVGGLFLLCQECIQERTQGVWPTRGRNEQ